MKSSKSCCVWVPWASASSISLSAAIMSLTRCMACGIGLLQGLLHAAELAVEHLAAQQVLELLEGLPRPPADRQS